MIIDSFLSLKRYCESEGFKGWDPYDGLNSRLAHALLPLKRSAILRLCVIQGFKRCPVNLRRLAMVPKEYNAKGIGLFLQGYCNLVAQWINFRNCKPKSGQGRSCWRVCESWQICLFLCSRKVTAERAGAIISTGRRVGCFCFPSLRQRLWRRVSAQRH